MAEEPRTLSPDQAQAATAADDVGAPRDPMLGEGVPRNVDPHDMGEADNPQLDWGDPAGVAMFSSNHTRRGVKTEAERGQGPKTRSRTKDIINRRP